MYPFDPALEAKSTTKERFVWMLFMGITFFLLYGAANQYAGITAPHPSLWMMWEKDIPFVPAFIVPYMSSDLMFVIAFFMPYTRLELRILAARVLLILLVSVSIFIFFPLQFSFDKPPIDSYTFLFGLLEADLPFNQLPSLHIAFAIVLWTSMRTYLKPLWLKVFVGLWFWLIVLSTLFVYQHHFIDLPTGALLGFLAVYLIQEERFLGLTRGFTTPRSLKMGLYYLGVSIVCMVLAFKVDALHGLFLWLFLSLFCVSLVYAFGLNRLLAGREAKASLWQWVLFAPYFVGNYISWHYYKRKLPLVTSVMPNVYLGRFPTVEEHTLLQDKGIHHALNLATEQQMQRAVLPQQRLPFLDQTIPDPEMLHQGVLWIESYQEKGVYIHCTLGLSRSVLMVSAWMLYRGSSLEETMAHVQKIRQDAVTSPYMQISLEMYQAYLEENRQG
jgi:protein-tyrosine phosphatase/membrane-associated phospholipid phosphatase